METANVLLTVIYVLCIKTKACMVQSSDVKHGVMSRGKSQIQPLLEYKQRSPLQTDGEW